MSYLDLKEVSKLGKLGERINLRLNNKAFSDIKGDYHSKFRGEGLDFDSVRKYFPGDDIRNIDWKVTARTGKTYIKLFNEDRSREIFFIIDLSEDLLFATKGYLKAEQIIFAAAIIAFAALANKDKVGACIFSDIIKHSYFLKAKCSKSHILQILDSSLKKLEKASKTNRKEKRTQLTTQLLNIQRNIGKNSSVILLTYIPELTEDLATSLAKISYKRHVELFNITDPSDISLPLLDNITLKNANKKLNVTITKDIQERYEKDYLKRNKEIKSFCNKHKINFHNIYTDKPIFNQIQKSFS